MRRLGVRKLEYLKYCMCGFFLRHKWHVCFYTTLFVLGLILGIVVSASNEIIIADRNYILLLKTDGYNIFSFFIKTILMYALCYVAITFGVIHRFCRIIPFILLGIVGYKCGGLIVSVILEDRLCGIIFLLIYIIPFHLILIPTLVCCACRCHFCVGQCGYFQRCSLVSRKMFKSIALYSCYSYLTFIFCNVVILVVIPTIVRFFVIV